MRVDFYEHGLGERELDELRQTLDTRFLAQGPRTMAFEQEFGDYLGVPNVVGLNSCTNSLFLCQKALGIGPGDEVITTPMTFVATSNSIHQTGAQHVFADVDRKTGCLDPAAVEAAITDKTKAIIVVHLYGQMVDVERFRAIADRHGLYLIEDAAHCVEGSFKGFRPGQIGHAAAFSFYATKNLASGEGGALVTQDQGLADEVRLLAYHGVDMFGIDRDHNKFKVWDVTRLGYKASMFDIQAALLLPQLRDIDAMIAKRNVAYARYVDLLKARCSGSVAIPKPLHGVKKAHHLFPIWCAEGTRAELSQHMIERDIGVGVHYPPVHLTTAYRTTFGYEPGRFPVAEDLGERCLSLPFFADITEAQQAYVVDTIAEFYERRRAASTAECTSRDGELVNV